MEEKNSLVWIAILVVGLVVGATVGYLMAPTDSLTQVNDSDVDIIRVPQSFGKTVSVSVDGSIMTILFENGVYRGYHHSGEHQIVWEES